MRQPRDEIYIVELCDDILGLRSTRQHKFDFLVGDPTKSGTRRRLPVDAYYPGLNLVVEYREIQHYEPHPFFDKRITSSGITRGEQRKKYDLLREEVLPRHQIKLAVLSYFDFEHNAERKLRRLASDRCVIRERLSPFLKAT